MRSRANDVVPGVRILDLVTLEGVRAAKPAKIYYGANTCWWTHDTAHLHKHQHGQYALPCDPRGGMLFETDDVEGFLAAAEAKAEHYGKYGLQAFMAAHHENCRAPGGGGWCFREWSEYERLLDRQGGKALEEVRS